MTYQIKWKTRAFFVFLVLILFFVGCASQNTFYLKIKYSSDYTVDQDLFTPFSQGYTCIYRTDKQGFAYVDEKGEGIQAIYKMAYPFENDGKALVETQESEWIYINTQGVKVAQGQAPKDLSATAIYDENGLFGIKTKEGKKITQPIFSWIESVTFDWNFAQLAEGEHKNVMIDPQGTVQVILPDNCIGAKKQDEVIVCRFKGGYQLLNLKGKVCNTTYFSGIGNFVDDLAPITFKNKVGLIRKDGTVVLEPTYDMDSITPAYGEGKITGTFNNKLVFYSVEHH